MKRVPEHWQTYLDHSLVERMTTTSIEISDQVRDPLALMDQVRRPQLGASEQRPWFADNVASGPVPAALLFDHLDRCYPGQGYDVVAHAHLTHAVANLEDLNNPRSNMLGMFSGLAGYCYVCYLCSRGNRRYTRLLQHLDDYFLELLERGLDRFSTTSLDLWRSFDVISGSAGALRYLLARCDDGRFRTAMISLVEGLIRRSACIETTAGFYVPVDKLPSDLHKDGFPEGSVDCGLAHGVPGVLAALSLVKLAGLEHSRLAEAIRSLSDWVLGSRSDTDEAVNWPVGIVPGGTGVQRPAQLAWCYGTPGVSMALLHASRALDDADLRQHAFRSYKSILRQPEALSHIERTPILCHGIAGLLQIAFRFLQVGYDAEIVLLATKLSETLIGKDALGIEGTSPAVLGGTDNLPIDFLEGSLGVALVLASAQSGPEPEWDQMLMLS